MKQRSGQLQHNFSRESIEGFTDCSYRFVYLRRTGYVKPLAGVDEFLAEEDTEAVREQERPFENFHGFNITTGPEFDQAIEHRRLGVRESVHNAMERIGHGRQSGLQILDYRINEELRSKVTREVGLEKQGSRFRRWRAGAGFFRNVANLVRTNGREVSGRLTELYGEGATIGEKTIFLARQVWQGLPPINRANLSNSLAARGVPVPFGPFPAGVNAQIMQIANSTPDQLEEVRFALAFLPRKRIDPIYPTQKPKPPTTPFDRLVELMETVAGSREKMLTTTVYDATRLQQVLDDIKLRNAPVHVILLKILERDALYPIEKNPQAQVLIAYIEQKMSVPGGPAFVHARLLRIYNQLPRTTRKNEEGKELTDEEIQLERIKELTKILSEKHAALAEKYNQADSLGIRLYSFQRNLDRLMNAPLPPAPPPAAPGAPGVAPAVRDTSAVQSEISRDVNSSIKEKSSLQTEINNMERQFQQEANELSNILVGPLGINAPPGGGAPDPYQHLRDFNNAFGGGAAFPSDETQLFGEQFPPAVPNPAPATWPPNARPNRVPSAFAAQINGFSRSRMKNMEREIKQNYHDKRARLTCRQLMTLLKEADYMAPEQGATNPEIARRRGLEWTNVRIAKVANAQIYRQANQEIAEYLGETYLGSRRLARLRKFIKAKAGHFGTHGVLDARDLIDRVAGFEKDFHMFRGLPRDATLSDIRQVIEENGGMSDKKLFEFSHKLKEVFESFEMLNDKGKVELLDGDALDLERLIENLCVIREEMRSRTFFEELRGVEGDKAEALLKKMRTDFDARRQDEIGILASVKDKGADWKQYFSYGFLKRKFTDTLREMRKQRKDKKMTAEDFDEKLKNDGLISAWDILKFGIFADEAVELGKTFAKSAKGKIKAAPGSMGRGVQSIWQKGVGAGKTAGKSVAWMASLPFRIADKVGIHNTVGQKKSPPESSNKK